MMTLLEPDRDQIERFITYIFRHAGTEGWVSIRAFFDDGNSFRIQAVPLRSGLSYLVGVAEDIARRAANNPKKIVFTPPLGVFNNEETAREVDLIAGLVLSVDCDQHPRRALATLSAIIGPPTVIVRSGGQWTDPETGEIQDKLHLHWRLAQIARGDDLPKLKQARALAARIVGGDMSNVPVCHPIRWPGGWHRKGEPVLCEIEDADPDRETDLSVALDLLKAAAPASPQGNGLDGAVHKPGDEPQASPELIAAALAVVPNNDDKWVDWNRVGMATWHATGAAEPGFDAFDTWSQKSKKYDAQRTRERWVHYSKSPPTGVGAGTIIYLANKHAPGWRDKLQLFQPAADAPSIVPAQVADAPPRPVDLWGVFTPPVLPTGLLPKVIEDFARVQATIMGADPAGLAVGALVVAGAAIKDSISLQVKEHSQGWTEEARIWAGLIGDPSTKKTPIIREAERPLRKIDIELFRNIVDAMARYNALDKDEKKGAEPPPQVRVRLEDTTIEAAQEVLKDSFGGVLLLQDELSGFFGSMDKYNSHRGAAKDRGFWLQAWNGGSYAFNRIGRGPGLVQNLSVSLLGGIQPDLIRKLASDAHDDGMLQRMFPIVLRPAALGSDEPIPLRPTTMLA